MADAPAHQRGGVPMGSGAKPTSPPPTVTGELLFYHVTGHHPRGYQPSGVPPATEFLSDPSASADREDDGGRKKRRKVGNRRGKLSEIWFDEAELAFCTSVASIPPNGRTKIKFFGRPLGRNELIAAICTLATRKVYNRKQISSHSQVLKDKVPAPYKEIFTFEDKSRGGDDTGESATANVIENYRFPEAIYRLLDIPVGEDLANREKPRWLLELEAGDNANAPETTSTMNFWAPAETYEYGYAPGRSTDRDGRGRMPPYESTAYMQPLRARDMPFPAGLPPPSHLDPQSPVTASGSDHHRRYPYASGYPQRLSSSMWDPDHSHSPTNSQFDTQSQSSGVSPRQIPGPGSWGETKPQVLPSSSDHLRPLGQLQDQNAQWGPVASRGGVQALPLPSLAGAATSPTYGLSSPSWLSQPTAQGAGGYRAQTWNGDARESLRPSFTPGAVELSLYTQEAQYPLSPSRPADNVVNGLPIGLSEIPNYDTRYPFLTSQPYNTPVFHINVPLLLGAGRSERSTLLSHAPDMALRLSLNTTTDSSGWHVVTESSYCPPVGHGAPTPLDRGTQQIREMHKGHPYTLAMVPQLATLLQNFTNNAAAAINSSAEAFLHMAITYFAVVQRIVRDSTLYDRTYGSSIGSDWSESAAIVIYSFALSTDPNAQVICRPVDFDIRASPPRTVDPVSDLIAGEAAEPSTFAWMRGSG